MERDEIRQALLESLRQEKDDAPAVLSDDINLREGLGLDSIDLVSMIIAVQQHFGIDLRTEELEKAVSVGNLLDMIQAKVIAVRSAA